MDIIERVRIDILFKYYGKMLTGKQQQIMAMYIDNNLSLAEVSEELNISRQAVKDAVDNSIAALNNMEEKLGFIARDEKLRHEITNIVIDENIKMQLINLLED